MTRGEAIQHFRENEVKHVRNQFLLKLESAFQEQKKDLTQYFQDSFLCACDEIYRAQQSGDLGEINFLVLTMLRTRIRNHDFSFVYKACDDWWLLAPKPFDAGVYHAEFVFEYYLKMEEELKKIRNRYVGKLVLQDVETVMMEEAQKFLQYVGRIAKYKILELAEHELFQRIKRGSLFAIHVGEYLDYVENIYSENKNKDYTDLHARFRKKKLEDLCFEDLRGTLLPNDDLSESDLRFSDLRNSDFSHTNFRYSTLIGAVMAQSKLACADFSFSLLNEAVFRDSELTNATFQKTEAYSGLENPMYWDTVGYFEIDFQGANLKGANFLGADLRGALFDGAVMDGALFSADQLDNFSLSQEQLSRIKVVR